MEVDWPARDVAVVVVTRDRPDGAIRAVRSLLTALRDGHAVTLVDQSSAGPREAIRAALSDQAGLTIVSTPPCGLGAARNLGVRQSNARIVAFMDDDCEATPGWVNAIARPLEDPRVGVVMGAVVAATHDKSGGCIPEYRPKAAVGRCLADKPRIEGIGACMAVRRSTWQALRGFDELFGAGAPLRSSEESDFVMRALSRGHWVVETPDAVVTHYGFRSWPEMPRLVDGYLYGLGAANAKLVRLNGFSAVRPLGALAWRWVAGAPVVDLGSRPARGPRLGAFLRGAWATAGWPIDPATGLFLNPPGAPGPGQPT